MPCSFWVSVLIVHIVFKGSLESWLPCMYIWNLLGVVVLIWWNKTSIKKRLFNIQYLKGIIFVIVWQLYVIIVWLNIFVCLMICRANLMICRAKEKHKDIQVLWQLYYNRFTLIVATFFQLVTIRSINGMFHQDRETSSTRWLRIHMYVCKYFT